MPLSQQNSVFIDPDECGSVVGYRLHIEEYSRKNEEIKHSVRGTIMLSDCNRMIDWDFGDDNLEKVDVAIKMLQEFRKKYAEACKMAASLNKK